MYKFFFRSLLCVTIVAGSVSGNENERDTVGVPWLDAHLVESLSFRYYYLETEYPSLRYPLVNSDGDTIKRGVTPFFNITGRVEALDRLSLYYNFQADLTDRIMLQRASLQYRYSPVSVEVARGTVWLGHGYFGSLLLSNNADPFTLVKLAIEEPVRLPYAGAVGYMIFHGWPKNFNIVGHRLSWYPLPWIQISGTKTLVYTQTEKLYNAPIRLFKDPSTVDVNHYRHARGSIDIAIHLPFLREYLYPLVDGKIYVEHGGEDIHSFWTSNRGNWLGPFGFDFIGAGNLAGIWLATEQDEIRVEYAQNYRNFGLFSGYGSRAGWGEFSIPWYGAYDKLQYVNNDNVMGHHMGSHADVIYFHYKRSFEWGYFKLLYSNRRRGLVEQQLPREVNEHPEVKSQYGIAATRLVWLFDVSAIFLWNRYDNVDRDRNPLFVHPMPGIDAEEYIFGLKLEYLIGR